MKNPYGRSDFAEIRRRALFYADKTPFLPLLESDEGGLAFLIFLRPRRFGKSTLLSMLEHYYDLGREEQFDERFKGLWVHEHPTPERSRYLVLSLDFSRLSSGGDTASLRDAFCESVKGSLRTFFMRYGALIPELTAMYEQLNEYPDAAALMTNVLGIIAGTQYKLYVLVDEVDTFANQLLSGGSGDIYRQAIVDRTGFVRSFYATLKGGAGAGAVARMFITGVSPLMLDDLSSGFNVATNVSQDADLNTLAGFTRADVERAVDEFLAARPALATSPALSDRAALLDTLERYYDGYRFSEDAAERVFNPEMVLYFLSELTRKRRHPSNMLDPNVRTEYRHLSRIGTIGGMGAAPRRELLTQILAEGHVRSDLVRQFGVQSLASRERFISLLYYLGMLTLGEAPQDVLGYDLEIPNRVIRELQWEHLALMLKEQADLDINVEDLKASLGAMAVDGDIAPFLDLFHAKVIRALGVKDTRGLDEKTIKLLFMMYASLGRVFQPLSEKEFAQGYCDLFLGASRSVANARFSWLLELKYRETGAKPAQIEAAFAEAERQVERYASDAALLPLLVGDRELKAGMLVFVGTKKVLFRGWPQERGAKAGSARPARLRKRKSA
jgi:hypothetical protein